MAIKAIYEKGVFRPIVPVDLPEKAEVEVLFPAPVDNEAGLDAIYRILGKRYASGHTDTAERHNEHQP